MYSFHESLMPLSSTITFPDAPFIQFNPASVVLSFFNHLLCHLLYADDLAMIAKTEEKLIKRLDEWKDNVESKDVRVSMNKTKVMISGERQKVRQKAVRCQ